MARVGLGLVAVLTRDVELAAEQYTELHPHRKMLAFAAGPCADRVLGCLARTIGHRDAAHAHFEDAIAFCRTGRFRPELAWTLHDYGEALGESDRHPDRIRALALLQEAEAIAIECSMRPLADQISVVRQSILVGGLPATPTMR